MSILGRSREEWDEPLDPRTQDGSKVELDLSGGVPLEDPPQVDEVLNRRRIDVGDTGEVEDDGAEDGFCALKLGLVELSVDLSLWLGPGEWSRVYRAASVTRPGSEEEGRTVPGSVSGLGGREVLSRSSVLLGIGEDDVVVVRGVRVELRGTGPSVSESRRGRTTTVLTKASSKR